MEPDGYTRWDTLPLAYPTLHHAVRSSAPIDAALRCIARIEPFELAARSTSVPPALLRRLAADYTQRTTAWSRPDRPSPAHPGPHTKPPSTIANNRATSLSPAASTPLQGITLALIGVVGPLTLFATRNTANAATDPLNQTIPAVLLSLPLLLPLGAVALASIARLSLPSLTLNAALCARRCPDCAAHLRDAPDAIDPALLAGTRTGPRACTRCKRPWPLLPPPAELAPDHRTTP